MKSTPVWLKSKRPFKTPRVCSAEVVLENGKIISTMYGVAFNNSERQAYYGQFQQTFGWQHRRGRIKSAEFKCEAICSI